MILFWKQKAAVQLDTLREIWRWQWRGAEAGKGVCVCLFMNVGETGRGDGVKKRLKGLKGGQRNRPRAGSAGRNEGIREEGRMSERIASCGSLYDSTNLLLQYCNNGELPLISLHQTQASTVHTAEMCSHEKCLKYCKYICWNDKDHHLLQREKKKKWKIANILWVFYSLYLILCSWLNFISHYVVSSFHGFFSSLYLLH